MSAEALIGVAASDEGVASEPLVPRSSRSRWYRGNIILWLRRTHGWIGLWGAALGLLFGGSGILLNHRSVLRIPAAHAEVSTAQIPLPQPYPADAADLGRWLQGALALQAGATRVREEPAQAVAWGDHDLRQPAHWSMSFTTPNANVQADWWVGNGFVTVKRSENNFWATLTSLHKGVGMGVGWVLLVDTLAGSIILLSLSGVVLWTQLNRRRLLGAGIGLASLGLMASLILSRL